MKRSLAKVIFPIFLTGALAGACGDNPTDEENAINLEGTWSSSKCEAKDEGGDEEEYSKEVATFEGGNLTYRNYMYQDSSCETEMMAVGIQGGYVTGEDAGSTDVPGASPLNLTVKKYLMVALTDEAADYFNQGKVCGFEDWEGGKEREVDSFDDCFGDDGSSDDENMGEVPSDDDSITTSEPDAETTVDDSLQLLAAGAMKLVEESETCGSQDSNSGDDNDGPPAIGETWYHIFQATEAELFWGNEDCAEMSSNDTRPTELRFEDSWVK